MAPTGLCQLADGATVGNLGSDLFAAYDAVAADRGRRRASHTRPHQSDRPTGARWRNSSNQSPLADDHDAVARSLADVPAIVHAAVPPGQALVLDRTEVVAAYGSLELACSEHAFFTVDSVANPRCLVQRRTWSDQRACRDSPLGSGLRRS